MDNSEQREDIFTQLVNEIQDYNNRNLTRAGFYKRIIYLYSIMNDDEQAQAKVFANLGSVLRKSNQVDYALQKL